MDNGWQFQRQDGTWCVVDRELEEAVLDNARRRDYWARELTGANETARRQWRRPRVVRSYLGFVAGLALMVAAVKLADFHPAFLLLLIPGVVLLWSSGRLNTWAHRTDPLPPPAIDA